MRQIVPQLCALAGACNPELAATLAALEQAAGDEQSDLALQQALSKLSEFTMRSDPPARPAGAGLSMPRPGSATDSDDIKLIQGVLKNLVIPTALEPLARDIQQSLSKADSGAVRQRLDD